MEKILFPIKKELEIFENKLKKVVLSEDNFLAYALEKFLFSNPKRLRPIFIFLFAKILKIDSSYIFDIALIAELIHSASLIHDDVIDEDVARRGNITIYKKYGSKLAVLEGDLLLSLALECISKTTLEISRIFASRIKKTILGEISQNENMQKMISDEMYFKKTYAKTANLFVVGLEALFTLSQEEKNLLNFIENYAIAFQIKNDIDNFKNSKSDIRNGNYTLPVIYSSLEKSIAKVEEYKKIALGALANIEDSLYKTSLVKIVNHTL
jgi:octaprenyl-diphosphate synthase